MTDNEEKVHAECSPSQLKRIKLCPGSRRVLRNAPDSDKPGTSGYAEEGTMLHLVTELRIKYKYYIEFPMMLNDGETYGSVLQQLTQLEEPLTREQNTAVSECVDYFDSVIRELRLVTEIKSVRLEPHLNLDYAGMPEVAGYVDVQIISADRLDIIDWKFGKGVPVPVEMNEQLLAYAGASFDSYGRTGEMPKVCIHLIQPRLDYFESYCLTGKELSLWVYWNLYYIIFESRNRDAECIPGIEQCRWCVRNCIARIKNVDKVASEIFKLYLNSGKANQKVTDYATPEQLAITLEHAKIVDKAIKDISAYILSKCLSGEVFPGYKAVEGRSFRHWRDEQDAQDWLTSLADNKESPFDFDDCFETKFISVAKAEKLDKSLKKSDDFKDLYHKRPGKPTLAPVTDPRKSIIKTAQSAFKDYAKKD